MNLEFRNIHIDVLALPVEYIRSPLSLSEVELSDEFAESCCVTRGIVLVTKNQGFLRYNVTHGFEVVRAAKKAHIEYIPCLIGENFTDLFISLLDKPTGEGDGAQDTLKPQDTIDKAIKSYEQIKGFRLSYRKAEKIGKLGKKSTLYDEKRLAKHLDPRVQDMVRDGKLSKSAGRSISYIKLGKQLPFAQKAIENKWTVKDIELAKGKHKDSPLEGDMGNDIQSLKAKLEDSLNLPVKIIPKTRETGSIQFDYYQYDNILLILERLKSLNSEYSYTVKGRHSMSDVNINNTAGSLTIYYKNLDTVDEVTQALAPTLKAEQASY